MAALGSGCPSLGIAAAGTVQGQVLFDSRPAGGQSVFLLAVQGGQTTRAASVTTNANGDYSFTGVQPGSYQVQFLAQAVTDGQGLPLPSGEINEWETAIGSVTASSGTSFPPFDVAYGGLLYPQPEINYYITAQNPVPFHWSTDVQGQRYQLQIYRGYDASRSLLVTVPWTGDPSALFRQNLTEDTYSWDVIIDGGNAGTGTTALQEVSLGPPPGPSSGSGGS